VLYYCPLILEVLACEGWLLNDTIQLVTSVAALILGIAYIIGGLIVNIHLSAYGVTEYQILRIKYLVVGLVYLVNCIILIVAAGLISIVLMSVSVVGGIAVGESIQVYFNVIFSISFFSSLALLFIWIFDKTIVRRKWLFLKSWWTYIILTIIALIFPLSLISIQLGVVSLINPLFPVMLILIICIGTLGQLYFYSRNLYGNPTLEGFDPIGMGIPVRVQLAGEESAITLLNEMGITRASANITNNVSLLDETDSHYIVSTKLTTGTKIYKVDKTMIKGLVYLESNS
jgi:hypothetical protein